MFMYCKKNRAIQWGVIVHFVDIGGIDYHHLSYVQHTEGKCDGCKIQNKKIFLQTFNFKYYLSSPECFMTTVFCKAQ